MSILSKEALAKIRKERAIKAEEDSADVEELFKRLDKEQRAKEQEALENADFDPAHVGDL
jgi:hypothetical protein